MAPTLKTFILALMLCGLSLPAFGFSGSEKVGKVSITQKPVYILRDGIKKAVGNFGMSLKLNDEIITGNTGKAQVTLADESQVVVGAKTRLKITKGFIGEKGFGIKRFILGLIGKMRAQVKKTSSTTFRVQTATATIGVKGTDFIVEYQNKTTTVGTLEGLVNMQSSSNLKALDIPPGKMSSVSSNGDIMGLQEIAGTLLSGVEIAGEKMEEADISGERVP